MYRRDLKIQPALIVRDVFVTEVLQLGNYHELSPNTIITAVMIGDRYVDECQKFYSIELAHTATVIACKYLEDWGSYNSTFVASDEVENHIIYDIELEICHLYNYCFPIDNILTLLVQPIIHEIMTGKRCLGSDFYVLAERICREKSLLTTNPMTILLDKTIYDGLIRMCPAHLSLKLLNKLTKNNVAVP